MMMFYDSKSEDEKLLEASEKGDVEKVKKLLKEGANVNAKDKIGRSPLHKAAFYRHIEIVKLLIENGANVNAKDNYGYTPLHDAAISGHIEIVKLLIENGAYVNAKSYLDWTPLHYAAFYGHIEIVKLLIEKGANVNAKDNYGWTPLHYAAFYGHIEVVKLLIEHGADPNIKNNKGKTAIDLAREKGYSEIVKLIEEFKSFQILKVEKKEVKPIQTVTPAIIKETLPGLNDIIPLRKIPLGNLVSGYGCSSKRFKVNLSIPVVPKEFEGFWDCCLLGCGGWGCAYLCIRGENKIVIKIPRGFEAVIEGNIEAPTGHDAFLKKIRSEAEIMGSLNHPNIIKLLGISNKLPLVIYEFADYGSLYWQLNKGWKPSIKDILLIGIQIGDALRYIHYRGLIHGDIKPSNIFIKDKIAKLGDFSSTVKLLSSVSISKMVYTVGFRAPEQVFSDIRRKAKELGVESKIDVYQLGNLLLYISTGESIDGEEAIDDKLVMEKLSKVPNENLKQILSKTLVLEPEKRPSAEDLTKMLYTVWNKV
jgi:ankyrin repeat protein